MRNQAPGSTFLKNFFHQKRKVLIVLSLAVSWGFFISRLDAAAPANDNFANATDLRFSTFSVLGGITIPVQLLVTTEATTQAGEPTNCVASFSKSVWYKFFSTTTFVVNAETIGSNYDTVLTIFRGDALNSLTQTACNDDSSGLQSRLVSISLSKNATYYFHIAVYGVSPSSGSLVFRSTMTFGDGTNPAVTIQSPSTGTFPTLTSFNSTFGTASDNVAVQEVSITLSSGGTNGEGTGALVWNNASLLWVSEPCASCSILAYLNSPNSISTNWNVNFNPTLADRTTYYIRAQAKDSAGNFSVVVLSSFAFSIPTVTNDSFVTPKTISDTISASTYTDVSPNGAASLALDRFPSCQFGGSRDVWYVFVSTLIRGVQANTSGSDINNVLAVWSSTGGVVPIPSTFTEVACNRPFTTNAQVSFQAESGTTYFFQLMSDGTSGGSLKLSVSEIFDSIPPSAVTTLSAIPGYSTGTAQLQWTAVGDDGNSNGSASKYDIRYSTTRVITDSLHFSTASKVVSNPIPFTPGFSESFFVSGLPGDTTVWFAMSVQDDAFNTSPLSNSATVFIKGPIPLPTNFSPVTAATIPVAAASFSHEVMAPALDNLSSVDGSTSNCVSIWYVTIRDDIWYKYVSTVSGLNFVANTFNSNADTVLNVWQDTGGVVNLSQFVPVTCNNDEPGFGLQSKVQLTTQLGATYYFQVVFPDSSGGSTLRFQFSKTDSVKPGNITTLQASPGSNLGDVNLTWLEPADDGYDASSGKVTRYLIRYSSAGFNISNANWSSTGTVLDIESFPLYQVLPNPVSPGSLITYTIRSLATLTTYYFAVRSVDDAGNTADVSNSVRSIAKSPEPVAGDGQGTAQLRDSSGLNVRTSIPVSSQTTLNIRFTVGTSSITGGGKITIRIPDYWSSPQLSNPSNPGYIRLSTITPSVVLNQLSLSIDSLDANNIIIKVSTTGKLNASDVINVQYLNGWTQYNKQNNVQFTVKSQGTGSSVLLLIASQPSINLVAGSPAFLGFADWNFITLGTGQTSPGILLEPKDNSWQSTTADRNLKARIFTLYWDSTTYTYNYDPTGRVSKNNFVSTLETSTIRLAEFQAAQYNNSLQSGGLATYYALTINNGSSGERLYYKTQQLGYTILWIEYNNDFDTGPSTYTVSRWFNVRSESLAFNNFAVTPLTISPNNDSVNDYASISFSPAPSDADWRIRIGTDPILSDLSPIANTVLEGGGAGFGFYGIETSSINVFLDWWGRGQPQGVSWYGTNSRGDVVADGNYIVRLEDVGSTVISTKTLTVQSAYIDVFVKKQNGDPVSGAQVTANGQSGSGFVFRNKQTGSNGKVRIWGLSGTNTYQVSASYYDLAANKGFSAQVDNVATNNAANVSTLTFTDPASIKIHATIPADAVQSNWDQWGFVNVTDNSGLPVGFGSLRFQAGSSESDSGWNPFGGAASSNTIINVLPNRDYKIRAEVFGFGAVEQTLTNVTGEVTVLITFVKKPKVVGSVFLPSLQPFGTWVSVEGTKAGDRFPTAWGGAWIQGGDIFSGGKTTGTYQVDVDTGVYNFKARAFGLGTVSSNTVTISSNGIGQLLSGDVYSGNASIQGGLNFTFGQPSDGITGVARVEGETTQLSSYLFFGSSFSLYINAWSPTNYSYANTVVYLPRRSGPNAVSSGTYALKGLDDGLYQVYTWMEGFEVSPPGAKVVQVTNGTAQLDLTLKKFSGQLTCVFNSTSTDFQNVALNVQGPISTNTVSIKGLTGYRTLPSNLASETTAQLIVSGLGTGFYDVSMFYKTNGQQKAQKVNIINGQTSTITFNLAEPTFAVQGSVKVETFNFGATASTTGIRIATVEELVRTVGSENVFLGNQTQSFPIVRIEAYPKQQNDFGRKILDDLVQIITPGCANCGQANRFNLGQVRFSVVDTSGNYKITGLTPGVYLLRHPTNLDPNSSYYNTGFNSNFQANTADIVDEEKTIFISTSGTIKVIDPIGGNLDFTYKTGAEISGRILLPSDVSSDTRFLTLRLQKERGETVNYQIVYLNGASANYTISNVANGDYTLILEDERRGNDSNWSQSVFGGGINRKKYVAKPFKISVVGTSLTGQDVQLARPGTAEGKLAVVRISSTGAKSTELITDRNVTLLPNNFRIFASAQNFGRSVSGEADMTSIGTSGGQLIIDSTKGTFRLSYLYPDTDYTVSFAQDSFSQDILGQGKLNVVSREVSGVVVSAGQTLDLGTIELNLGLSLNGSVKGPRSQADSTIIPLQNIRVSASPSTGNGKETGRIETFTNAQGSFTLSGLDADLRFYDITYAERSREDQFVNFAAAGVENKYAQKVKRNVDVKISSIPADASLELGLGSVTGKVVTQDGGLLKYPFGDLKDFPVAAVIMNKQGDVPTKNPIGDIETNTDFAGNFSVDRLAPGSYDIYAFSLGYGVKKTSVTVTTGQADAGTITVPLGLELSGKIVKPGNEPVTTNDIDVVVAVTSDFSEITIGSVHSDAQGLIDSYSLAGLKSGTTYTALIFTSENDTIAPPERYPAGGDGISITTNVANFNLTFAQAQPQVFMKAKKTKDRSKGDANDEFQFQYDLSQSLRKKTSDEKADDYWKRVLTIASSSGGAGSLSEDTSETNPINPKRDKVTILYTPAADTRKVTLRFRGASSGLQPGTSNPFLLNTNFDFYPGLDGQRISRINMMQGGKIGLEGDNSQAQIPAGAFLDDQGKVLKASSTVNVGMQKAKDVATSTSSVKGAPGLDLPPGHNLPPSLFSAMQSLHKIQDQEKQANAEKTQGVMGAPRGAAQTGSEVASNVLGAFYEIFLPAGVKRSLAKNAILTLSYSSATADTNLINVYFYNDTGSTVTTTSGVSVPSGSYGLENSSRTLDSANNTITVNVNHFTTYVVVSSTQSVLGSVSAIGASSNFVPTETIDYGGTEIDAFNFPNPFDPTQGSSLISASKTLVAGFLTVTGTKIRYALPANLGSGSVRVSLEIFDVAGQLVRRIDYGAQPTGKYGYGDWDGKNENGQVVASGVYIGRLFVHGSNRSKIFKMAVIK